MSSFIYNQLKKTCESLGKHNDALYAVLAIAMFKGVMRPTFTMMDKKSDPKSKKYAAFREGLTEAIAFGSYIATHKMILPLAVPLAKKTGKSPKKIKNGLSLLSVCLTAGIIIPLVCNWTLKPIMDGVTKLYNKKDKKSDGKLDIKENTPQFQTPAIYSPNLNEESKKLLNTVRITSLQNYGMKVGG